VNELIPAKLSLLLAFALAALLLSGCITRRHTDPEHTATEQLLLSTAADRASQNTNFVQFAHQKVYVDPTYFAGYDSKDLDAKYALGAIRDALSSAGALLVDDKKQSEVTIEARNGALSADERSFLFGIPGVPVPLSVYTVVQTPELALFKSNKSASTAKFALLAYATQSREHLYSSGAMVGRAYLHRYTILFISWRTTNVPEIRKARR
jgi:hypothetical protein